MSRRVSILPLRGLKSLVVAADVAHELSLKSEDGREHSACDDIAFDLAGPQLVDPR